MCSLQWLDSLNYCYCCCFVFVLPLPIIHKIKKMTKNLTHTHSQNTFRWGYTMPNFKKKSENYCCNIHLLLIKLIFCFTHVIKYLQSTVDRSTFTWLINNMIGKHAFWRFTIVRITFIHNIITTYCWIYIVQLPEGLWPWTFKRSKAKGFEHKSTMLYNLVLLLQSPSAFLVFLILC